MSSQPQSFEDTPEEALDPQEARRLDWERNHEAILQVYADKLRDDGSIPSVMEVAEKTGLSRSAVKNHFKSLKTEGSRFDHFRAMTELVVEGIAKGAMAGDARCGKLFLQFIEGWVETKKVNQVNQNPYSGLSHDDLRKKLAERLAKMKSKDGDPRGSA